MEDAPTTLALFVLTTIALLASPGPATLALAASGATHGLRRSLRFFAGVMLGLSIAIAGVSSGLLVLIRSFPVLAIGIAAVSTVYLLFLAYSIARTPPLDDITVRQAPGLTLGFIVGITNMKAYAVFAALLGGFPLAITEPLGTVFKVTICLGTCVIFDFIWLWSGTSLRRLFTDKHSAQWLNRGFALMLVGAVGYSLLI